MFETPTSPLAIKRTTSLTIVNIDESVEGKKCLEYYFASDARFGNMSSISV